MQLTKSIVVNQPVEQVWEYMQDATREVHWRTNIVSLKRSDSLPEPGVGMTYAQKVKGPPGGAKADLRYTVWEPGQRMAFETTAGAIKPNGDIRLAPVDGGTTITAEMTWEPTGFMKLFAGPVEKQFRKVLDDSYANLKRVLDSGEYREHIKPAP